MASLPKSVTKVILVITTIVGLVIAQNTPNTTDITTSGTLSETVSTTTERVNDSITMSVAVDNSTISIQKPKSLQDLQATSDEPPDTSPITTLPSITTTLAQRFPPDCSQREKLKKQPEQTYSSRMRKCCPIGETLVPDENSEMYCAPEVKPFAPQIIKAEFYENCIEDLEEPVKLDIEVGNPCNESFTYAHGNGDRLFVLQDGTLLVMDEFGNDNYLISADYCLDTDPVEGNLFAIVCYTSVEHHVSEGQTILFMCFMLISVPCLCIVSFLHIAVKELRSVHGMSLSVMSACLAIGFFLHTIAQFSEYYKFWLGYVVQFFMLSYFFWLFSLCCNVVLHTWYYLPHKVLITRKTRYVHFILYGLLSFSVPFLLVLVTKYKGLPGMPSYFFQGLTESIRESQRYFIQPVTYVLLFSFCMLVVSFFGFKSLSEMTSQGTTYQQVYTSTTVPLPSVDQEGYQEIKKDAKCISCLFVIIMTTWILEIVTFYSPGQADYIAFMEICNAVQGVFILMIFIVVRRRRNAIVRWWYDRGSHEVTHVEMASLRPSSDNENGTELNGK